MTEYNVSVVAGEADEEEEEEEVTPEDALYAFVDTYRSSELTKMNLVASNLIQQQKSLLRTEESVDLEPFHQIEAYLGKVKLLKARVKRTNARRETINKRLKEALVHLGK